MSDETPRSIREWNPDVPLWLETLVTRLMEKSPDDRLQSAGEVAKLLEGYLAHLQEPATIAAPKLPRTPGPSPDESGKRSPLRRLLAALILLAVVGTGVGLWLVGGAADKAVDNTDAGKRVPGEMKVTFFQDLCGAEPKDSQLRMVGENVRWDASGVRVSFTPENAGPHPSGLAPSFKVQGDFEITGSYEILRIDEKDFPPDEIRFIQFGGFTGGPKSALEIQLLDFTVRAEAMPGLVGSGTEMISASEGSEWLVGGLVVGLTILFLSAVGAWLTARWRSIQNSRRHGRFH